MYIAQTLGQTPDFSGKLFHEIAGRRLDQLHNFQNYGIRLLCVQANIPLNFVLLPYFSGQNIGPYEAISMFKLLPFSEIFQQPINSYYYIRTANLVLRAANEPIEGLPPRLLGHLFQRIKDE